MAKITYQCFNQLHPNKVDSKVKVRVIRIWTEYNLKNNNVLSLDMELMDEKGEQIHAMVQKWNIQKYQPQLKEGELFYIEKFDTKPRKDSYRPVNHEYRMCFTKNTTVHPAKEDTSDIPVYKFNFVDLEDVESRLNVDTYLTDVIGKVIGATKKRTIRKANGKDVPMRVILIEDGRGNKLKIKLWADASNQISEEILEKPTDSIIVIATSTIVRKFEGDLELNSTNATKLFINLEIPEVEDCRERCKKIPMKGLLAEKNIPDEKIEDVMLKNSKTISELYEALDDPSRQSLTFTCKATITSVNEECGWYYMSCPSCRRKVVVNDDKKMSCFGCKNIEIQIPKPRYRLELEVEDSTGSATIVVLDTVAENLIQQPCTTLFRLLQKERGIDEVTQIINKLVNSYRIFRIKLNDYNITLGNKKFTANKVYPLDQLERTNKEALEESSNQCRREDDSEISKEMEIPRKRLCIRSKQHQTDANLEDF